MRALLHYIMQQLQTYLLQFYVIDQHQFAYNCKSNLR